MVTTQQLDYLYLKMPGTEPVTLTTKRGPNNDTINTETVSHAWRRDLTGDDEKGFVTAGYESLVWNLPNILLNGSTIKIDDTITDAENVVWVVKSVSRTRLRTHWRCICRREK